VYKISKSHHRGPNRGGDNLFGWTIFILFLAGFALLSWIGSFYIFGHPENAFSYRVLRTLGKIEPPRRFELTAAPRGRFLDADKLFERFGSETPLQLAATNQNLLRNYLRNYQQTKDLVPYVIGPFNLIGAFRLGPDNFFREGIVALAVSTENPSVLIELVFPAEAEKVGQLERILTPGLDVTLARTLDLTAILNARLLADGRLVLTAVPLLYGSYTSTDATGTFHLEPPAGLNVAAGLPVLNQAAIDKAGEHYRTHLQRLAQAGELTNPALMRVQQTETARPETVPVARALPVDAAPTTPDTLDGMPVARALPVDMASVPVARALPVDAAPASEPPPTPDPPADDELPPPPPEPIEPAEPLTPPAEPGVPLEPFVVEEEPETAATPPAAGSWTVYDAGRMPRGRLLEVEAARQLAGQPATELSYLAGDFRVTASGPGRAVLRGRRGGRNVRVIADFPAGSAPPAEGASFRRDSTRPFQITSVEESPDGQINIYVREVTRP